jgi:uncharacterized membrane protein
MISILPNWHPIFVHFSIGLLGIAVLFYFASALLAKEHHWKQQWQHMANWSLWSGCLVTIFTVFAGWYAYNTVAHDQASHAAMTLHRDWALATASLFLILGLAAASIVRNNKTPRYLFLSVTAVAGAMLMVTGFLGGEAVYRHGLGVMSLPKVEVDGNHHDHNSPHDHEQNSANQHDETTIISEPSHHLDQNITPSMTMDSVIEMDEHPHDVEVAPTTTHDHQH